MRQERLLQSLIDDWKNHPSDDFIFQRSSEAAHVYLRLGKDPDGGCFPVSIAFTHGSAALTRFHIPLNIEDPKKLGPLAYRLARKYHQDLTFAESDILICSQIKRFIKEQDYLWFITQKEDCRHVFGVIKKSPNTFIVFDTAAEDLGPEILQHSLATYDLDSVLRRSIYHQRLDGPIRIVGFKNKSKNGKN